MALATLERAQWLTRHILVHEPEVRAWLRRRDLSGIDVDDVVQESYAILAGLASVDHIYQPRIYLFQVAKSVVLQTLRKSRVVSFNAMAEFDILLIPDGEPSPEAIAAARQELGRIAKGIEALPPKCRQAFVLRRVRGLSQREVAAAMAISENTVEKHIGKALGLLGNLIGRGGKHQSASSYGHAPVADRPDLPSRNCS